MGLVKLARNTKWFQQRPIHIVFLASVRDGSSRSMIYRKIYGCEHPTIILFWIAPRPAGHITTYDAGEAGEKCSGGDGECIDDRRVCRQRTLYMGVAGSAEDDGEQDYGEISFGILI